MKSKKKWIAMTLNTLIPGLGLIYLGTSKFVVVGAFLIVATYILTIKLGVLWGIELIILILHFSQILPKIIPSGLQPDYFKFIFNMWSCLVFSPLGISLSIIISIFLCLVWLILGLEATEYINKKMLVQSSIEIKERIQKLNIKYCPYCGSDNPENAKYCRKCGKKINN